MARSNTARSGQVFYDLTIGVIASDAATYTLRTYITLTSPNVSDSVNDLGVGTDWEGRGGPFVLNGTYNAVTIWSQDLVVNRVYGATVTATVSAAWSGVEYWGATLSASESYVVPARPYDVPTAPSGVTVTRSTDTSLAVSWTRHATAGAPYDGQSVWVSIDGAAAVFVANVTATATSYTYTSAANHEYVFTIKASNSAGTTASAASNTILTTPAALASLAAASISSGVIRLTLPVRPTPHTDAEVVVTETHDGGATWNAIHTFAMSDLSASASITWDDTSAETGGTVQYRAVVQTTAGTQGVLSSGYTTSNTLVLNTPPLAPTNLTPSGAVDASRPIRLGFTHNPSSDGALQSSRKIEYSVDGGSTQTSIVAGNTTTPYYDWSPTLGSFTAGQTITWRVATAGSQPGTYGAWSEWQTLTLYGSLAVTLTANNPPSTHTGGPIPVAWTSSATWGTATQAQYQVTMTDQASGDTVYDTGMVTSTAQSTTIPSNVQVDGHVYSVTVTLSDNHQIESAPVSRAVTADYLAPGPVELTWSYDDESGSMVFYPTFTDQTSSPYDDTYSWTLERSLDGVTWETVGSVVGEWSIPDPIVRLGVESWYRTTSYTELEVAGEPTVWNVPAADVHSSWGWINFGDLYQSHVRFGWSQTVEISSGRASESYELEGSPFPVAVFGDILAEKYTVGGKLIFGSAMPASKATASGDEMLTLAKTAGVGVFRDARGAWFTCRITDMKVAPVRKKSGPDEAGVSFTAERVMA